MKKVLIKSYAKINIALNVNGKTSDGYHDLDMIMVPINMHDSILMNVLDHRKTDSITVDDYSCRFGGHNLASLVIDELRKRHHFKEMFRVDIHKVIPIQAGFGGGSSNAAATMKGVDQLLNLNLSKEEMLEIALKIGSDVPFFVENKPMRCKGRGEIMTPIFIKNNYYVVLTKPTAGCSTKDIYAKCDELVLKTCNMDLVQKALQEGDDDLLAENVDNSLYEPALFYVPEIKEIIATMKENGAKVALMTGSGSGTFCLTSDKKLAKKIYKALEKKGYDAELTEVIK